MAKAQHREVVTLYNLSRRISGNMWHSITEDLKQHEVGSKEFTRGIFNHVDFEEFKHWQGVRQSAASEMVSNIDTYRPLMKQQGVDPVAFAANFIGKEVSAEHKHGQIQKLIKGWKLETPDEGQALHVCDLRQETRKALIQAWSQSQKDHTDKSHLILTYTNKDTALLNEEARSLMRKSGRLAIDEHLHTIKRESQDDFGRTVTRMDRKAFAVGERLVFTRNDKSLDVKNGTLGTIIEMDRDKLKVKIDKAKSDDKDQIVSFSTNLNPYIDQGWAITIIKSQGSTADRVFKLATHEQDRNLAYVGMTRHKEFLAVFGSKLDFWREEIFTKRLSQTREKLSSLDYLSKEEARSRVKPPARLTDALTSLGDKLESWGYTSRKSWESLSARFTGQEITGKEWTPHVSHTIDETIRAREMMTASPEGVSSMYTQGDQARTSNTQSRSQTESSFTYGSGKNNPGASPSVVITDNISDFIDRQTDIDTARNMKDKTSHQVDSVSQGVASFTQEAKEKEDRVGSDRLKESVHDILTNSTNNKVAINNIIEKDTSQKNTQQTSQLSEDQERDKVDDQKIVVQNSQSIDKAGPAPLTSVPNSEQEPTTHAPGLESGRSTTETTSIESQVEATLDQAPAILSPKEKAIDQEYKIIRDYVEMIGKGVKWFDQHYKVDPEHAVSSQKSLLETDQKFIKYFQDRQHYQKDYEKIRLYVEMTGKNVAMFDRHYYLDPEHAITLRKEFLQRDNKFHQHMAKPDMADVAIKSITSPVETHKSPDTLKVEDLIAKIQRVEHINLDFKQSMQTRIEARDQLRELYKQASADSIVIDKFKQEDPKMLERLQNRFDRTRSRSQGLER